ncbi:helix-turn-helix transcriptional regulator [Actinocorallia populi]|uniref:helix-turn-helix transcriptional regulator n=1 Tax=Actinocorallia populi TaxID=2079200 RepID=UPI000D0923EE|nr:helix-turn-helix transcriptional regulator [Actinocorallia populi]
MDSGDFSLGGFLRRHRDLLRPDRRPDARRRVPGARRDEIARAAGISTGHYARLEQDRAARPSWQTVAALARALHLDDEATAQLYRLARPAAHRSRPARRERVSPEVRRLMDGWNGVAAIVVDTAQDVLARNAPASVLHGRFTRDGNVPHMVFLDPAAAEHFGDWNRTAADVVADLRRAVREAPDDPRLTTLVGELSIHSAPFRRLWAARETTTIARRRLRLFHPEVGELHLTTEVFAIARAAGQRLVTYQAEPGSASADALVLLGTLAARTGITPGAEA